ncbi:MAG: hypothetical protein HQK84_04705 [Nitrospinae bacterium]|nr:hypothetical protein [Nitrospinota bacterium]
MNDFKLSVIIPCYQETENLRILLPLLISKNNEPFLEIIIVDASEDYSTLRYLQKDFKFCRSCTGKSFIETKEDVHACRNATEKNEIIVKYKKEERKERGFLMNKGASYAEGNIYFFLFADAIPPDFYSTMISYEFLDGSTFLSFEHTYNTDIPALNMIADAANYRLKNFDFFYGDHGIVVSRELFETINGFPDIPIFEDAAFTKQANSLAKLKVIDKKIIISDRKYEEFGVYKVTSVNLLVTLLWKLHFNPTFIKKTYSKFLRKTPKDSFKEENSSRELSPQS